MFILLLLILLLISVLVSGTDETRLLGAYNDEFHPSTSTSSSQAGCPSQLAILGDDEEDMSVYSICSELKRGLSAYNDEFHPDDKLELHFQNEVCFYCSQEASTSTPGATLKDSKADPVTANTDSTSSSVKAAVSSWALVPAVMMWLN